MPLVIVISGPGGVGKGTVVAALVDEHPDLWLSRSWTTRPRRPGEREDAYVFVPEATFRKRIAEGGFLEYTEFLGNFYGTPLPEAPPGLDLVLEIDVQGARQVAAVNPHAVLVFLQAPSVAEQEARLRRRGDPEDKVAERLAKAREEADAGAELGANHLTNVDVGQCAADIYRVIEQARSARRASSHPTSSAQ